MSKKILILSFLLAITGFFCFDAKAQNRDSVSAKEVNGTFQYKFKGKFKDFSNQIKILALGKGKLKIQFDLVYPYSMQDGEPMVNIGQSTGTADIEGDTAIFTADDEYGDEPCKITIIFTNPGEIKVTQDSSGSACGFGHNVSAEGTYKKINSSKPTFDDTF
jgi:hypothetical protein